MVYVVWYHIVSGLEIVKPNIVFSLILPFLIRFLLSPSRWQSWFTAIAMAASNLPPEPEIVVASLTQGGNLAVLELL